MILLSVEAKDGMSEVDPLILELILDEGSCWLEVSRCGFRVLSNFSAHWREGRWWKRTAVLAAGEYVTQDEPSTSYDLAHAIFGQLSGREEFGERLSLWAVREALDEGCVAPVALALEVLAS